MRPTQFGWACQLIEYTQYLFLHAYCSQYNLRMLHFANFLKHESSRRPGSLKKRTLQWPPWDPSEGFIAKSSNFVAWGEKSSKPKHCQDQTWCRGRFCIKNEKLSKSIEYHTSFKYSTLFNYFWSINSRGDRGALSSNGGTKRGELRRAVRGEASLGRRCLQFLKTSTPTTKLSKSCGGDLESRIQIWQ